MYPSNSPQCLAVTVVAIVATVRSLAPCFLVQNEVSKLSQTTENHVRRARVSPRPSCLTQPSPEAVNPCDSVCPRVPSLGCEIIKKPNSHRSSRELSMRMRQELENVGNQPRGHKWAFELAGHGMGGGILTTRD